ncbi:MAG: septum formation initiator family protein [Hyphomicrobiales bacterium]|nr:septum formation initiator family protein [Hyphomicrobiales bacterium]
MRRYGFDLTVTVVCFCLLGFFAWHGLNGKRSFANQKTILVKVSQLEEKRDNVRAKREALQTRVALLRPESIDADMLEEMARTMLGFTKSNEIVISD